MANVEQAISTFNLTNRTVMASPEATNASTIIAPSNTTKKRSADDTEQESYPNKKLKPDHDPLLSNETTMTEAKPFSYSNIDRVALLKRFKALPTELMWNVLRMDIESSFVEDCLTVVQMPMILQVLEQEDPEAFAVLLVEYKRIHARIHSYNLADFNKRKVRELMLVKHVTIIFPLCDSFRGQKITSKNEIESLFFDFSMTRNEHDTLVRPASYQRQDLDPNNYSWYEVTSGTFPVLEWIIGANKKVLRKFVVKLRDDDVSYRALGVWISRGMKLSPLTFEKAKYRYHVWEKANDGVLTWNTKVHARDLYRWSPRDSR